MNVTTLVPPKLLSAFQQIDPSVHGYGAFRETWSELCLRLEYESDPKIEFSPETLEFYFSCLTFLVLCLTQDD
jgi:hypothetical protein